MKKDNEEIQRIIRSYIKRLKPPIYLFQLLTSQTPIGFKGIQRQMQRIRGNLCLGGEVYSCFLFSDVCLHRNGVHMHMPCPPLCSLVWSHLEPGLHRKVKTYQKMRLAGALSLFTY